MTTTTDTIPTPPPAPSHVLAAFAAIGLPGVRITGRYQRNAEAGWYLRVQLPPRHTADCLRRNRCHDLHAALGWPGRLWLLPATPDPYDLALVFHDPGTEEDFTQ